MAGTLHFRTELVDGEHDRIFTSAILLCKSALAFLLKSAVAGTLNRWSYSVAQYHRPHSDEWFQALEACNPVQAEVTRRTIAVAGRDDVCSICGDQPANDYQVTGEDLDDDAVATIRLCADCRGIREQMYSERFDPMK